ncbi:hypothetical protein EX30DRAFT_259425 [Ascodesmis nigricans]|uniref:Uncharacterized protein n=1 Tax=Ascodesmis nigricans TaxID=341454 RepID=A0A4S2MXF7_9PEZI|nr:hypothetical protein EX30DRAFT_259425 [Ascodesmis nigricans]
MVEQVQVRCCFLCCCWVIIVRLAHWKLELRCVGVGSLCSFYCQCVFMQFRIRLFVFWDWLLMIVLGDPESCGLWLVDINILSYRVTGLYLLPEVVLEVVLCMYSTRHW